LAKKCWRRNGEMFGGTSCVDHGVYNTRINIRENTSKTCQLINKTEALFTRIRQEKNSAPISVIMSDGSILTQIRGCYAFEELRHCTGLVSSVINFI